MAEPNSDLGKTITHIPSLEDIPKTELGAKTDLESPNQGDTVGGIRQEIAIEEIKERERQMVEPVGAAESTSELMVNPNATQTEEKLVEQVSQTLTEDPSLVEAGLDDTEIEPHKTPPASGVEIPPTPSITVAPENTPPTSQDEEPTEIEPSQETAQQTESSAEAQLKVGQKVKRRNSKGEIVEGWEINSIDRISGKYLLVRSDQTNMTIEEFSRNGARVAGVSFKELEDLNPELITEIAKPQVAQ